jgi:hypothetical protein
MKYDGHVDRGERKMDETQVNKPEAEEIKEIVKYGAKWDMDEHEGYLWLRDTSGAVYEEKIDNAREFQVLVHLLQTEKPIYYHPVDHYVSTSIEHIGDARCPQD